MACLITTCPSCREELKVKKLECRNCGISIEGDFDSPLFTNLSPEQASFVRTFLKARGSIKEVEKLLSISYPTVRSRLDDVLKTMGLFEEQGPAADEILGKLSEGEISVGDALDALKGKF